MYYTMNSNESPYHYLGARLRMLREAQHESLREVSEAVEIDSVVLKRYEAGHDRPSEGAIRLDLETMPDNHAAQALYRAQGWRQYDESLRFQLPLATR